MADCTEEPIKTTRPVIYRLHRAHNNFRYRVREIRTDTRRFPNAMDKHAMEKTLLGLTGLPEGVREYGMPDPSEMTKLLPELSVEFYDDTAVLPDRFSCQDTMVVSGRAKRAFERIDPEGGHEFVPVIVLDQNNRPVNDDWHYMLCGRSFFASDVPIEGKFRSDSTATGWFEERHFFTQERRLFFARQSIWTPAARVTPKFLSKSVFDEIKAEGLTGFREFTKDYGLAGADDPHIGQLPTTENVSHYWL